MVSFKLDDEGTEEVPVRSPRFVVVTQSLIVGNNVYKKGDIITDDEDTNLTVFKGLKLVERLPDEKQKRPRKSFFKRLFRR